LRHNETEHVTVTDPSSSRWARDYDLTHNSCSTSVISRRTGALKGRAKAPEARLVVAKLELNSTGCLHLPAFSATARRQTLNAT
jgi:hypothetical protein